MDIEQVNAEAKFRCSCGGLLQVVPNHDLLENRLRLGYTHCMSCHSEQCTDSNGYLKDAVELGEIADVNGIYFQMKELT